MTVSKKLKSQQPIQIHDCVEKHGGLRDRPARIHRKEWKVQALGGQRLAARRICNCLVQVAVTTFARKTGAFGIARLDGTAASY